MSNVFLSLMTLIMSFNLFAISYQINGINRVVVHTPTSIFEINIPLVNNDYLYFNKTKLENDLLNYYSKNIERYTNLYDVSFYYYDLEDGSICLGEICRGIEVTVNAKLTFNYSYSRTMFYEIEER